MKPPSDEELILHYYGEGRAGIEEALADPEVAARWQRLRRLLDAVPREVAVPERAPGWEEGVWQRVRMRLQLGEVPATSGTEVAGTEVAGTSRWRRFRLGPAPALRWAAAFGLLALLAGAFWAGGLWRQRQAAPEARIAAGAVDRVLLLAVAEYLEKSERLFLELANRPLEAEADLSLERDWAVQLTGAGRLYRQAAVAAGASDLAYLLQELEPLLLESAHAESPVPAAELEALRQRLHREDLLFKVRVVGQGVESRLADAPGAPMSSPTTRSVMKRIVRLSAFVAWSWAALCVSAGALAAVWRAAAEGAGHSAPYHQAQAALEAERWAEAAEAFAAVAARGGEEAPAALYWQAYAEHRRGRPAEALAALRRLAEEHPGSAWSDDAQALEVEIRGGAGAQESGDDELKLYALNSLIHTDPERAVPILERFLAGDHSPELEERALFVLAQSGSPRAREVLRDMAQRGSPPELRFKAVEYLGVFGGRESDELLVQIYAANPDPRLRAKILEGLMISGAKGELLTVARQERDPELRAKAIEMLAVSGAREELRGLYAEERDPRLKRKILESTVVSGDTELLRQVLASETDPDTQRKAIELMGVAGGRNVGTELLALYRRGPSREIKRAVLDALMIAGDGRALLEIVRSENDPELKRAALEKLALVDDEVAAELIEEILEE